MRNPELADTKQLLQLRREVFTTIKILSPNFQRSEAFNKRISDTLNAFSRAGLNEAELMRMTIISAQKFIKELAPAAVET